MSESDLLLCCVCQEIIKEPITVFKNYNSKKFGKKVYIYSEKRCRQCLKEYNRLRKQKYKRMIQEDESVVTPFEALDDWETVPSLVVP